MRVGVVDTDDPHIVGVSLDDICEKKIAQLRVSNFKRNNLTTVQIKEKIIMLSKEINKIRAKKGLTDWEL